MPQSERHPWPLVAFANVIAVLTLPITLPAAVIYHKVTKGYVP